MHWLYCWICSLLVIVVAVALFLHGKTATVHVHRRLRLSSILMSTRPSNTHFLLCCPYGVPTFFARPDVFRRNSTGLGGNDQLARCLAAALLGPDPAASVALLFDCRLPTRAGKNWESLYGVKLEAKDLRGECSELGILGRLALVLEDKERRRDLDGVVQSLVSSGCQHLCLLQERGDHVCDNGYITQAVNGSVCVALGVRREIPQIIEQRLVRLWLSHGLNAPLKCCIGDYIELSCTVVAWARLGLVSLAKSMQMRKLCRQDHPKKTNDLHLWVWRSDAAKTDPDVARIITAGLMRSCGIRPKTTVHFVSQNGVCSVNASTFKLGRKIDKEIEGQSLGIDHKGELRNLALTEERLLKILANCSVRNVSWEEHEQTLLKDFQLRYLRRNLQAIALRVDAVPSSGFPHMMPKESARDASPLIVSVRVNQPVEGTSTAEPAFKMPYPAVGTTACHVAYLVWAHSEGHTSPRDWRAL